MNDQELTAEQRGRIAEVLADKGVEPQCPACHRATLKIEGRPTFLPFLEGMQFGLALAILFCPNCAFVQLHVLDGIDPAIEIEFRDAYDKARGITRPKGGGHNE